jgi:hypothetical protein
MLCWRRLLLLDGVYCRISAMRAFLGQFWRAESGFTVVEYGVFAAVMALVIILGVSGGS